MRKIILASLVVLAACHKPANKTSADVKKIDKVINAKEVERIERILSADDMEGRGSGTPGIEKAAAFIESEFAAIGLDKYEGLTTYQQEFAMIQPKEVSTSASVNGKVAEKNSVIVITQQEELSVTDASGFEKVSIKAGANLFAEVRKYMAQNKNQVIVVDTALRRNFSRLAGLRRPSEPTATSKIFVLSAEEVNTYNITAKHAITRLKYSNVVGVLPGKSRKDEFVVFSGHYDHLGIGKPTKEGDSVYNGANDDAAGTTAMIMLAKHFKKLGNNERTLVFVAFTAEEVGGFGSSYFSQHINPDKVMAMFNIEMVGTESKWGRNSAYITGFDKSDMGTILQKNLQGSSFTFYPDPYPDQNLFLRSDNATLARLGVPAHTISTAKMDKEPYYHSADDEIETLDMQNMAEIIKAIAISSRTIISGQDTPTRVKN